LVKRAATDVRAAQLDARACARRDDNANMAHRQVTSFTTEEVVSMMDEGSVDGA
jgi:hypothetical protein